ncbi:hypothetical protein AgCh_027153 [Apium graveolens]
MDDDVDFMEKEEEGDPMRKGKQKMNNSDFDDDFNREEKMNINDDSDSTDDVDDVNRKKNTHCEDMNVEETQNVVEIQIAAHFGVSSTFMSLTMDIFARFEIKK